MTDSQRNEYAALASRLGGILSEIGIAIEPATGDD
jgi:hypothetical protein